MVAVLRYGPERRRRQLASGLRITIGRDDAPCGARPSAAAREGAVADRSRADSERPWP
jgi:hypothetical protein